MPETKPSTRDLSAGSVQAAGNHDGDSPRFIPSGLRADGYAQTRIRKMQKNQSSAVVAGLGRLGITTTAELRKALTDDATDSRVLFYKATQFLQGCLVGPEKPVGPAQLFRKGQNGTARLMADLSPSDVAGALGKACDQVGILQDDTAAASAQPKQGVNITPGAGGSGSSGTT